MHDIRAQFPILETKVKQHDLIYFDNAASTQKPLVVIDKLNEYYRQTNSNIHRGAHFLANKATEEYEATRIKIAEFIGANPKEVVFTSGTTDSINLLMNAWGRKYLKSGDNIVLSEMEHHANIVPWLQLQTEIGLELRYIPMQDDCTLDITGLNQMMDENTRLVSIAYISNAMGSVHPISDIVRAAKSKRALVHLDCAQAIAHREIKVEDLEVDFLSFSSHKMYGPMGVGVFWGKAIHLENMNPYRYGGEMIREVYLDKVTFNDIPFKFEAGTPNVGDVIALGSAIEFIDSIGWKKINHIESELYQRLYTSLAKIPGVKLYSPPNGSTSLSFNIEGIHPFDLGMMLDSKGIAIRTGHHCCQPLMRRLDIEGTCRASICIYNTSEEIDIFVKTLESILKILQS